MGGKEGLIRHTALRRPGHQHPNPSPLPPPFLSLVLATYLTTDRDVSFTAIHPAARMMRAPVTNLNTQNPHTTVSLCCQGFPPNSLLGRPVKVGSSCVAPCLPLLARDQKKHRVDLFMSAGPRVMM